MKLKHLYITDNMHIGIHFYSLAIYGGLNKENDILLKRTSPEKGFESVIPDMSFEIYDREIIQKVLEKSFLYCDKNTSPQSICCTNENIDLESIFIIYDKKKETFDTIVTQLLSIINKPLNCDKTYINSIQINYPKHWIVKYEK